MSRGLKKAQNILEVLRTIWALSGEKKVLGTMLKNGVNPHAITNDFYKRVKNNKQIFKNRPEDELCELIKNAKIGNNKYICSY
jgi:hypothetical protein